jgi:hypothetical protein
MMNLLRRAKFNYVVNLVQQPANYALKTNLATISFTDAVDGTIFSTTLQPGQVTLTNNPKAGQPVTFKVTDNVKSDYANAYSSIYQYTFNHVQYKDNTTVTLNLNQGGGSHADAFVVVSATEY